MIFRFRDRASTKARATHHIPHGAGPDEEFVVSASIGVGLQEEAAPHAAIIEREGWRARHVAPLPERRPVVSAKGLRYSCVGPDLIRSPFRVVGAALVEEAASLLCTVENYAVDVGKRGDLRLRCGIGAANVSDARATHGYPPSGAYAHRRRDAAVARYPRWCSSANRLECGGRAAEIRAARRT